MMETEVLGGKPSKNKEKGKKITTKTRIINWKKKAVRTKNLKMHLTWSKVYVEIAARKILRVSCLKFWIKQSRFGKLCCLVNLGIWNIYQISNWFDLSKFCTENLAANIFFRFSSVDISPLSHIFKPDFFTTEMD